MKKIVLTGGGTAGHVTPNIALLPSLKEAGFEVHYIGSYNGIEKKLIEDMGIPYYGISSGKLRRYFDVKNFSDPFRVIKGFSEAKRLMKELKPDVVFFGEGLPEDAADSAFEEVKHVETVIVVGTSGEVMPACLIPRYAKRHGAKIIEVNLDPSAFVREGISDLFLQGKAGEILPELVKKVLENGSADA